jgi:hypothetical protein
VPGDGVTRGDEGAQVCHGTTHPLDTWPVFLA